MALTLTGLTGQDICIYKDRQNEIKIGILVVCLSFPDIPAIKHWLEIGSINSTISTWCMEQADEDLRDKIAAAQKK